MIARYTRIAVTLHWLIAVLIVTNVALAWIWPTLPDAQIAPVVYTHKSIGVTVLGLVVLRLLWRLTHRPPPLPAGYKRWETVASRVVHGLLYAVMLGLPLTGWLMDSASKHAPNNPMLWFGLFEWPRVAPVMNLAPDAKERLHELFEASHELAAFALFTLLFLHIGAALKHQFLDREKELQRMWIGK